MIRIRQKTFGYISLLVSLWMGAQILTSNVESHPMVYILTIGYFVFSIFAIQEKIQNGKRISSM